MTNETKVEVLNDLKNNTFDIVTDLFNRIKIMPEENSLLLTFFNSIIKDWISENIGDIKNEDDSSLELSMLSEILIHLPITNEEISLEFITFLSKKENGNLELHVICKDIKYKKYNRGLLFNKNKIIKDQSIDNLESDIIPYIYAVLFEGYRGLDIVIRDKIISDIKTLITEYMNKCIESRN